MSPERLNVIYLYMYLYLIFDKALLISALVWHLAFCFVNAQFFEGFANPINPKSKYEKFPSAEQYMRNKCLA